MSYLNPKELEVYEFANRDPFKDLGESLQIRYVRGYLADLGVLTVVEEPNYFDRDYLEEFSSFYSTSAQGYPNTCRRLHFFNFSFNRQKIIDAAGENPVSEDDTNSNTGNLNSGYLGFTVIRPIPAAPLGRTVLRWYPDGLKDTTPRITKPSRVYKVHLAGIRLLITGLAWQQQDSGVGACATVCIWSILHSSAFDDHHAIPTTAGITKAAHKYTPLETRMFPSVGLQVIQMCDAIREHNLSPALLNAPMNDGGFSRERFSSSCAAYIRSGYPVLLIGDRSDGRHAICVVGFRSCPPPNTNSSGTVGFQDSDLEYIYVHDDNIGPNVRFRIETIDNGKGVEVVQLVHAPPTSHFPSSNQQLNANLGPFRPQQLLVAVHNDLRTSPDALHRAGIYVGDALLIALSQSVISQQSAGNLTVGLTMSARFVTLAQYLRRTIPETLTNSPSLISKVRIELCEKVPPMSLHLGLVRFAAEDSTLLVDVIYDTTDSDRNHPVFAHILYQPIAKNWMTRISTQTGYDFGVAVEAY